MTRHLKCAMHGKVVVIQRANATGLPYQLYSHPNVDVDDVEVTIFDF